MYLIIYVNMYIHKYIKKYISIYSFTYIHKYINCKRLQNKHSQNGKMSMINYENGRVFSKSQKRA